MVVEEFILPSGLLEKETFLSWDLFRVEETFNLAEDHRPREVEIILLSEASWSNQQALGITAPSGYGS